MIPPRPGKRPAQLTAREERLAKRQRTAAEATNAVRPQPPRDDIVVPQGEPQLSYDDDPIASQMATGILGELFVSARPAFGS